MNTLPQYLRLKNDLRDFTESTKGYKAGKLGPYSRSQVLDLTVVLKLRLLSQLSFVINPYSQRVTLAGTLVLSFSTPINPMLSASQSKFSIHYICIKVRTM